MPILNLWKNDYYYKESKRKEVLQLFTDRSIYRPGQTVYVSGLAYEMEKDSTRVLADKKYTVSYMMRIIMKQEKWKYGRMVLARSADSLFCPLLA